MATGMNWQANIRQLRYPREFRISASPWPSDLREQLKEVAHLLSNPKPAFEGPGKRLFADVGTGLWRLRNKMLQPGTTRPIEEMRRAFTHLQSVWDALDGQGITISDHTGQAFEPGRSLQVLAFQPTPGLTRDIIVETIKPTIYFKDDLVQTGEVIVGTPEATPRNE
jgi:hypothetical protein